MNAVTINNINIKNPDEWKYNKLTTVKGADGKDVTTTELLHTGMQRFNGADNRMVYSYSLYDNPDKNVKYAGDFVHYNGKNAVVLDNTSKGYGYTANITVNAQPVDDLMLMLAYTHTESKEVSGLPGSDPISTWQGLNTIDGSNYVDAQRSQYVVPDKVIASGLLHPLQTQRPASRHTPESVLFRLFFRRLQLLLHQRHERRRHQQRPDVYSER